MSDEIASEKGIGSVKLKAYIYLVCVLLSFIPLLGYVFALIGLIFIVLAILGISRISQTPLLLKFVGGWVLIFIGGLIQSLGSATSFGSALSGAFMGGTFIEIVGVLLIVGGLVLYYFFYTLLSKVTDEAFFFYAFVLIALTHVVDYFTGIGGMIFAFFAVIVEFIAWFKFKTIHPLN